MHKIAKSMGINQFNKVQKCGMHAVIVLTGLTSLSKLFVPCCCCGSFARSAARFATMSNISFNIAPSAATSDELLSNPMKAPKIIISIQIRVKSKISIYFTHFQKKGGHSIALLIVRADIPIAIPFVEYSIHHHVFYIEEDFINFFEIDND